MLALGDDFHAHQYQWLGNRLLHQAPRIDEQRLRADSRETVSQLEILEALVGRQNFGQCVAQFGDIPLATGDLLQKSILDRRCRQEEGLAER